MNLHEADSKVNMEKRTRELLDSTLGDLQEQTELEAHNTEDMVMSLDDSWEDYKKRYVDSLEIVDPRVTPVGQTIVTTATLMNVMQHKKELAKSNALFNADMLDELKGSVSNIQIVVAVGAACNEVKAGDKVVIELRNFMRVANPNSVNRMEEFALPIENIRGRDYLHMHERDVKYIVKPD